MSGTGLGLQLVMNQPTATTRRVPDWMILTLACIGQFMVVLDVSIVNVALPSIRHDLHYSASGLQWVVNAYVLTFAGFLLLGGRAADLFGRRRVYMAGLGLFTVASVVGGLAQDSGWLTAARAAQGIGGAILSPATLTLIVTTFSGPAMAKSLGIWSAVAGGGGAAGSILGGVLTSELSWRWVLFVNLPIGAATLAAAAVYLTESKRPATGEQPRLDVGGAILVTLGLGVLIYAIVGTNTHAWTSAYTISLLAAAAVLLGAFGWIEAKVVRTPLVPFRMFRSRSLTGANIVMLLIGAAFFSMWYFMSLYLQTVLGYGALKAGMAFLPMAISIMIGAQVSSRLVNRIGVRPPIQIGTVLATVGFAWLSGIGPTTGYLDHVFGPGIVISFALGMLFTPLAAAATSGIHYTEAGLASGVLNTSRQVGGSLGLAILATIANDRTHAALHSSNVNTALTDGFARAFQVAAGASAVAFLAAFVVPAIKQGAPARPGGDHAVAQSVVDGEEGALPVLDIS